MFRWERESVCIWQKWYNLISLKASPINVPHSIKEDWLHGLMREQSVLWDKMLLSPSLYDDWTWTTWFSFCLVVGWQWLLLALGDNFVHVIKVKSSVLWEWVADLYLSFHFSCGESKKGIFFSNYVLCVKKQCKLCSFKNHCHFAFFEFKISSIYQ